MTIPGITCFVCHLISHRRLLLATALPLLLQALSQASNLLARRAG